MKPLDYSKIRHVQPGDPVSAEVTSQPTRAIEERLGRLDAQYFAQSETTTGSRLILPNVDIRTDTPGAVGLNNVVFFNPATSMYELAIADVTVISGTFSANPSALAVGVVVDVRGSKADVMIGGVDIWGESTDRTNKMDALLVEGAAGFVAGTVYYLSDTIPGKLTRYPPALKIQVLVSSDVNLIVQPIYATPDAIENIYPSPIGMRPVGSVRTLAPDQQQATIVGFDALEQYDATNNLWRSTAEGSVTAFANFGYILADASVILQPSAPVYVRLQVDTSGNLNIFSASTLADLLNGGGNIFNQLSGGTALTAVNSGNFGTVRNYNVTDPSGTLLGQLSFAFTAYDVSLTRHMIFRFPDHFQGWKATNACITPTATAAFLSGGAITAITVNEGSTGYTVPPTVVISDGSGSGATAVAVLNELGTITSIQVTAGGTGYVAPTVSFVSKLSVATVLSSGSGATASATVASGVITSVAVTAGGTGYLLAPDVQVIDSTGVGAVVTAVVLNGVVKSYVVVNGGTGYTSSPVLRVTPKANSKYSTAASGSVDPKVAILNQSTTATLTPVMTSSHLESVEVLSGGYGYTAATLTVSSAGTSASIKLLVDSHGTIVRVDVLSVGSGFTSVPNVTALLSTGNGGKLKAYLGASIQSLTISNSGAGNITDPAIALIGTPLRSAGLEEGGSGYTAIPTVTISAPDIASGTQATATARLGGSISRVLVTNLGSGYHPATTTLSVDAPPSGVTAVLIPIFDTSGATGTPATLIGVQIVDPGSGYRVIPSVTITDTNGTPGTGAVIQAFIEGSILSSVQSVSIVSNGTGYHPGTTSAAVAAPPSGVTATVSLTFDSNGSIIAVVLTNPGTGYTTTPAITIADTNGTPGTGAVLAATVSGAPIVGIDITNAGNGYVYPPIFTITPTDGNGTGAAASATLYSDAAQLALTVSGAGGIRTSKLQLTNYDTDMPGVARPTNAPFYYNIKADPNLKALYPAVPIDKVSFMLNGVEMRTTVFNETQKSVLNPDADIAVSRRTILWTSCDAQGCPWDAVFLAFVYDYGIGGRDCIIPGTNNVPDGCYRMWDQTFKYEPSRNQAWLHLNKASRFHQTGRVQSLSALAPLRLIDVVTGNVSSNDGSPMTGQLMIVNDNDDVALGGTNLQINLTNPGELVIIFNNTTGRPVVISSVLLLCTFNTNTGDLAPDASYSALVTVGTQDGDYRDLIGTTAAVATRLYAVNQAKELFPDADQPAPVIQPGQSLYVHVAQPAGAPIETQVAVARVKGVVL